MSLEGKDPRVPMMEIDALYRGQGDVDEVMAAVDRGSPSDNDRKGRLFYAHLYVGLYWEALDQSEKAKTHLLAADQLEIPNYMWYVAHSHADRIRKADAP